MRIISHLQYVKRLMDQIRKTQISERSTFVDIKAPGGLMSEYCNLKTPVRLTVDSDCNPDAGKLNITVAGILKNEGM